MCDCYSTKDVCKDHGLCRCEPFIPRPYTECSYVDKENENKALKDAISDNYDFYSFTVGYDHDDHRKYCCEWKNTCVLYYVNYDKNTKMFQLKDSKNNIFTYDERYILAY